MFGNCLNNVPQIRNTLIVPAGIFSNITYSCPKTILKIKVGMNGYLLATEVAGVFLIKKIRLHILIVRICILLTLIRLSKS